MRGSTVVNKNTNGDNQMYLLTKLQTISLNSDNHIVTSYFANYQSIVSILTVPSANISPPSLISLSMHFHTHCASFLFFLHRSAKIHSMSDHHHILLMWI
uniref:Uncharacterized protein n=1 Tax=Schistosoma mansoni TaxID=6183 RepID=A0AA82N809_SCHMA